MTVSFFKLAKLKAKFRAFKTEENEIKHLTLLLEDFPFFFCVYFGDLRLAEAMFSKYGGPRSKVETEKSRDRKTKQNIRPQFF